MNTKTLFATATAAALMALNAGAFASPAVPVIGQASHLATLSSSDNAPQTAAQRQQDYLKRMALIGRTVRYDEVAPAPVSEDKPAVTYAERVQQHEERMKLVGRTAQPGEVTDDGAFDSGRNGSRFSAKQAGSARSTQ